MTVRIASLGSGSKGNGTLIDDGEHCLLVDLGFNLKETVRRLSRLEVQPERISAVLVTHEHADHIHGVAAFARKFGTPVYLSHGTYRPDAMGALPALFKINCHAPFKVGTFQITPVPVPHDAREPCQYVIESAGCRVGVLTDLGHVTPHVTESYRECDALLLECNHDLTMLENGPYPYPLKQRVGGDYGHLNNQQAAELLGGVDLTRLRLLVLTHLSEQNNQPELAEQAVKLQLSDWNGRCHLATQNEGFDWISVN